MFTADRAFNFKANCSVNLTKFHKHLVAKIATGFLKLFILVKFQQLFYFYKAIFEFF